MSSQRDFVASFFAALMLHGMAAVFFGGVLAVRLQEMPVLQLKSGHSSVSVTLLSAAETAPDPVPPAPEVVAPVPTVATMPEEKVVQEPQPPPPEPEVEKVIPVPPEAPAQIGAQEMSASAAKAQPLTDPLTDETATVAAFTAPEEPVPVPPSPVDADAMEKGVESALAVAQGPSPLYPPGARRRGEQGTVRVKVWVQPDGLVRNVELLKSSGYDSLDRCALETLHRRWKYAPLKGEGREDVVDIVFRLEEPVF